MKSKLFIIPLLLLTACGGDYVVKSNNLHDGGKLCLYQEHDYGFNIIDAFLLLAPTVFYEVECVEYSVENYKRLLSESDTLNDLKD